MKSVGQNVVYLDHWPNYAVEAAVIHCLGQTDAEYLQQSVHFVGQIDGFAQQGLARTQKCPKPMCLPALHVYRAEALVRKF